MQSCFTAYPTLPWSPVGGRAEGFAFPLPLFFREPGQKTKAPRAGLDEAEKRKRRRDPALLCRKCGHRVTSEEQRLEMDGGHRHTFFNPAGIVYELGCFSQAPGCVMVGGRSGEFSWFRGFLWRVALCSNCGSHLGWHFLGNGHGFYGLILKELVADRGGLGR